MLLNETPLVFDCQGEQLLGVIHHAPQSARLGLLVVVGGPQYRVGSHRQFVLLARYLAKNGVPVMRFDVRGMGDSEGSSRRFDELDEDIRSAVDFFVASESLEQVIIWGLCDAASAALFYAYQDERVAGLVLLNPWVFTEQGAAKTYLKHYYLQRLMSRDFWRKVFSLKFDVLDSLTAFAGLLRKANISRAPVAKNVNCNLVDDNLALPIRMRECFKQFNKPTLLILSGRDLTADEFRLVVSEDAEWQSLLNNKFVTIHKLPEADHTFSAKIWRDQVAEWTFNWILDLH